MKRFIFKRKKAGQPERVDLRNGTSRPKNTRNSLVSNLSQQFAKGFARRTLRARAVLLKLDGDVFDGRKRAQNMNFLVRGVDINL